MSTTVLQDFLVKIGFGVNQTQLAAAEAGMARAGASAAILDKEATAASAAITTKLIPSLRTMLLPLTAVTAAIGLAYHEMFHFIESSAEGFDEVSKLSNRVNATATNILKLGYIATVSGSSVEAARSSLDGLNKAAGETALGIGRAKVVFKEIGLSVKDSNGHLKDTGDLLLEVGDKIKGMERGKQLAILEKLRIDPTMIESLTTDVSGLGKEFDDLYSAAGIDAEKAAKSSQDFIDTLDKVKFIFKTIKDAIAVSFFDEFKEGAESFRKVMMTNLPKIIASIKPIIKEMVKLGSIVIKVGLIFGGLASDIISALSKINDATDGWALKIAAVAVAWKRLNFAFLRSPIGMIIELALAFALLYDDYKVWEKGGNAFIDWGGKLGTVTIALSALAAGFVAVKSAIKLATIAETAFNAVMNLNPAIRAVTLLTATVALLVKELGKAKELLSGLNATKSGTKERGALLGKYGGLLSAVGPAGVLGAGLYNPQGGGVANNKSVTINHKTDIHVSGSGNPYETANAVKNVQSQVYSDQLRNGQGAVR
jgi:hypothetical protein